MKVQQHKLVSLKFFLAAVPDSPIFPSRGSSFSLLTEIYGGPNLGSATQASRYTNMFLVSIGMYL